MILRSFSVFLALVLITSCSTYKPQATPFRLPQAYTNVQNLNGLSVAAFSWQNEEEAKAALGSMSLKPDCYRCRWCLIIKLPKLFR